MQSLKERIVHRVKSSALVHQRVRYNPRYYDEVRDLLRGLDAMGRDGRRELSLRLTERVLGWARQSEAGKTRGSALGDWPILDKTTLRARFESHIRPECSWLAVATAGEISRPAAVYRSLRSIASEQAFMDDLLGVWDLTFAGSRIARLGRDDIQSIAGSHPPYGVYRNWRKTLMLAANHLDRATTPWFHEKLREFEPEMLYTEPTSGGALIRHLMELGLDLKIPLVLLSSDGLEPELRRLMEERLDATVIDYYRQPEGVAFAAGIAIGAYFFNPLYGLVELAAAPGAEAPAGHRSLEIVGTGFWNEAMPLVRYRTGDVAIVPESYTPSDLEDVALGLKSVVAIRCGAARDG